MVSNMGSNSEFSPARLAPSNLPPWAPDPAHENPARPVWVQLNVLFNELPGDAREQMVIDGLDLNRRVRGLLRRWWRGSRGQWLGEVTYPMHYADGREHMPLWRNQLVPAHALAPRADNKPLR
jgi:hypothetical protein